LQNCYTLSSKKPLADLFKLFAKNLNVYGEFLSSKIPTETEIKKGLASKDYKRACLLLNTADYCHNTCGQLEEKVSELIDSEYKEKIEMNSEKDNIMAIVTNCIKALSKGMDAALDPAFLTMSRIPWSSLQAVGDQSEYVGSIIQTIAKTIPPIRSSLANSKYFRIFCDKFVESFTARFLASIYKCKPILEIGAEQMLLDCHALKTALLTIPNLGANEDNVQHASLTKLVNKGMGKSEILLKVLLTSIEPPEGLVENYLLMFADTNLASFQKVIELKGLKKQEMQTLSEVFLARLPVTPSGTLPMGFGSNADLSTSAKINENIKKLVVNIGLSSNK